MTAYKNFFLSLLSIQIVLGTLYFLLFEHFRQEFILEFMDSLFFNFIRLIICFLSVALWIVSVGYLYMVSSKILFLYKAEPRTEFLISKSITFLKDSFVVAIVSFFVLYL